MAETMLQIFQRHRDCFDFTKEPNWQESDEARQLCYERQREREQAANEYVSNILASNEDWAKDIDGDVSELALSFQRILNKAERKAYREATEDFLLYVATALREHRVKQLSPITRYRMGKIEFPAMNVVTGLSGDEAKREFQKMNEQGFTHVQTFPTDAFPAVYTAFGYKPKASTPAQETPKEWLEGKPKEILDEAVNCGLAKKNGDCYTWIEGNQETGWQIGLYGYFVLMVCKNMNWLKGEAKRLDWQKFKAIFKNHDAIVGTAKQTVDDFKKGINVPTFYFKVDKLIERVFETKPTITPKALD